MADMEELAELEARAMEESSGDELGGAFETMGQRGVSNP